MSPLYAYSLAPVLAVAVLLFFTSALRGSTRSLSLYCLGVAMWAGSLLLTYVPSTSQFGERFVASGAFIAAGYIHVAFDITKQRARWLVWVAYVVAAAVTLTGAVWPGSLYGPRAMVRGPLFWPAMILSIGAAAFPSFFLIRAYRTDKEADRKLVRQVLVAGVLCAAGGTSNALMLSSGVAVPFGMLFVLASLLILGTIIRNQEPARERRILERSLLYAAVTAFMSAGFMLGVMSLMSTTVEPLLGQYRLGAMFLLGLAALAFEPIRQQLQEIFGRMFLKGHSDATQLARALEVQEEKTERAERLAEIGTLVSAVAHEVRNPLGVLAAHLKILKKTGANPDTVDSMNEQIDRATRFVDDLLRYGRPRPLELRMVDIAATLELSMSTAVQGLRIPPPDHEIEWSHSDAASLVEGDQAQLTQLFVILFDNALLALLDTDNTGKIRVTTSPVAEDRICITIEDSGPGIPQPILQNLFQPFVTGRKREGPRPGTGLGLATARRLVERHGGTIGAQKGELGGARFDIVLPRQQALLSNADAP